jgi:hypothetical protein
MMPNTKKITRLLAAIAATAAVAHAVPAAAQSARYCTGNVLVAISLYGSVTPNGKTADVTYYGTFQNRDPQKRALTALMVKITKIGRFSLLRVVDHFDLAPNQHVTVNLFSVHTERPGGSDAPMPAEVGSAIRFVCIFRPA